MNRRSARRVAHVAACLAIGLGGAVGAEAQQWDARLDITPFPSPYLSDWEANPTIGTLTITNPTGADRDVLLVYRVTDHGGRLVASGRSDPQLVVAGPPTVLTDFVDLSGTSEHDRGLEDQMRRTGRLPEGDHTACVVVTDGGGFVLAEDCVTFTIVYPDPPYLIGPFDGEALASGHPIFQWTPSQVPPEYQLNYVLRLSEVLANQAPLRASVANIPVFETTTFGTNLEYPISAPPLEEGKTYVWRVQALDQNGYPAAANDGRSEVWTFRYGPDGGGNPEGPMGPYRATLAFFDPGGELPELLAMIDTSTFERFAQYLLLKGRDGTLEIPLPLPVPQSAGAVEEAVADAIDLAACVGHALPEVVIASDPAKKSAGIMYTAEGGTVHQLLGCFGVPRWNRPEANQDFSLLFAVDRGHGMPRVTLGIKLPHFERWGEDGFNVTYSVFILNLLGDFVMRSEDLPDEFAEFYGSEEIEVWGTSVFDLGMKILGFMRNRTLASGTALAGQTGMNFYAVVNLGLSPELQGFLRSIGILDDVITLQGFKGYRERTYRGVYLGAARPTGSSRWSRRVRDNWFVRASIPTRVPSWWTAVSERRLEVEIGSADSATGAVGLVGDAEMHTRRRIVFRDVLGGFDSWKSALGVPPDSTLEFFQEFRIEGTGGETALFGAQASGSWGFDGMLTPFNGVVHVYNPKLTISRGDPAAAVLSNPLHNVRFALSGGFGFGPTAEFGQLQFIVTTRPDIARENRRQTERDQQLEHAARDAQRVEEQYRQVLGDWLAALRESRSLPAGSRERQEADVRASFLYEHQRQWLNMWEDAEQAVASAQQAAAGGRMRSRFGFSLAFNQGASLVELAKFAFRIAQNWRAP